MLTLAELVYVLVVPVLMAGVIAGVARWRGVRLLTVLRLAGVTRSAVDILPCGLDAEYVDKGENLGRVRRPLCTGNSDPQDDRAEDAYRHREPRTPAQSGPVRHVSSPRSRSSERLRRGML